MNRYPHLADVRALVGREIGCSEWLTVDQARIDLFAQATGDHQWIHCDPVRAAQGPFGATVANKSDTTAGVAPGDTSRAAF